MSLWIILTRNFTNNSDKREILAPQFPGSLFLINDELYADMQEIEKSEN